MKKKSNDVEKRAQWGSKMGFILAAAGSAVGLGNIWKFPGKAYEGGGGLYLLIYLLIVVLIGIPVMMCEFSVGRGSKANAVDSFVKLGHKKSSWIGWLGVIVAFVIACYYSHVVGYVMRYVVTYIGGTDEIYADPTEYFYNFLGYSAATGEHWFPWSAILFAAFSMVIICFVIIKGVQGGIEKFNKIGMPALFVMLLILLVRSCTMPGAGKGLKFLLTLDFSRLSVATVLSALGQAFYSLSLGMAIMITYASYVPKSENIPKSIFLICSMDTLVAFIAGFMIIPAMFSTVGAEKIGKGATFAFTSLAGVFQQMPGGRLFGVLFYLLLLFAALTSCISILEGVVAFLTERYKWKRSSTTVVVGSIMFLIGCVYTCSQLAYSIKGIWFDFANGVTFPIFGDFMEFLIDRLLMPVCALGVCLFVGWVWKPMSAIKEMKKGCKKFPFPRQLFGFMIRYLSPTAILLIMVFSFIKGTSLS